MSWEAELQFFGICAKLPPVRAFLPLEAEMQRQISMLTFDISQGGRKRSRDGSLRSFQSANGKLPVGRKWEAVLWRQFYRLPSFTHLQVCASALHTLIHSSHATFD